jgi:Rad3-related DNA helicase
MKKEFLSIKEFAELAGKKQQTIYKQLNNRLNPYVQLVENQKMLKYEALEEIYGITVEQPIQPKLNNSFNSLEQTLQSTVELLKELLAVKDNQIEELHARLAEAHKMADQAQKLHGAEKVFSLTDGKEQQKKKWPFWK